MEDATNRSLNYSYLLFLGENNLRKRETQIISPL